MSSILEGELAADIAEAMADVFYAAIVTRLLSDGGPPHNPGPSTPEPHDCFAFVDDYTADLIDGTRIETSDRKVIILASSLEIAPKPGDQVTIRGDTGTVIRVAADPALAAYDVQVRF